MLEFDFFFFFFPLAAVKVTHELFSRVVFFSLYCFSGKANRKISTLI